MRHLLGLLLFCLPFLFIDPCRSYHVFLGTTGVGLDDTFIITGSYFRRIRDSEREKTTKQCTGLVQKTEEIRTKPLLSAHFNAEGNIVIEEIVQGSTTEQHQSTVNTPATGRDTEIIVQRIHYTLHEVGLSISLTTATTTFAFFLGCISSIPGIRWLCLYAGFTIVFDFLFQITLFVAFLVLDERRIEWTLESDDTCKNRESTASTAKYLDVNPHPSDNEFFMDRFMKWYSRQLMRPTAKVFVIVLFITIFALNVWSTTLLEQAFNIEGTVSLFRQDSKHSFLTLSLDPDLLLRLRIER